jgi:hypothetical protein
LPDLFDQIETVKVQETNAAVDVSGGDLFDKIEAVQVTTVEPVVEQVQQVPAQPAIAQPEPVTGASPRAKRAKQFTRDKARKREQFLASLPESQRAILEDIGGFEALAIGAGKGFTDIGRAVGLVDEVRPEEKQAFERLKTDQPIAAGGGEILGQSAPFIPLGLGAAAISATPARVAATSALGALEGGLITAGQGGDAAETITGAGIGGVVAGTVELAIPVIGRLGGKLIRKVTGKAPTSNIVTPSGQPTPEFESALKELNLSFEDVVEEASKQVGEVNPQQAARKAFLESQGIEPTKAQVTREASDFQAQQEAVKTSNKVRAAIEGQEAIL